MLILAFPTVKNVVLVRYNISLLYIESALQISTC